MELNGDVLLKKGLSNEELSNLLKLVHKLDRKLPIEEQWDWLKKQVLKGRPFDIQEQVFLDFKKSHGNEESFPAWYPNEELVSKSHLNKWMKDLNFGSYDELYQWSFKKKQHFVEKLIASLEIQYKFPPREIMNLERGIEHVEWFKGAKLNIVDSCFRASGEATAIIYQKSGGKINKISYGDLQKRVARVANSLRKNGVQVNDRVAIYMPMTPESVFIFLGVIAMGATVVTIADSFSSDEVAVRLEMTQAKFIFLQDAYERQGKIIDLYTKIKDVRTKAIVISNDLDNPAKLRESDDSWECFLVDDDTFVTEAKAPEDMSTILFSSGTTGQPKGIPWTHVTPIKSAGDAYLHHDIHEGEVLCWPTNLGWMMGPWLVYAALINKGTIALSEDAPLTRNFGTFVQDAKVTMLGLVPSLVSVWRKTKCMEGLDWSAIKLFSSTGEASNTSDMLYLMSLANYSPVFEYCGGTETGGGYLTGCLLRPSCPGLFSTPAMGYALRVLDESGKKCQRGEVFFEAPVLGLSNTLLNRDHYEVYYKDTPATEDKTVLRRHGDEIELLPEGYFKAHGRVDDTMNLGGIKVSAVQIEEICVQIENVNEVAAIAVSPNGGGPSMLVIFATVSKTLDSSTLKSEMQSLIRKKLNPLFKIEEVVLLESLPRTASNKIMRRKLRDTYEV